MKLIPITAAAILAALILPAPAWAQGKDAEPKRAESSQAAPADAVAAIPCAKPRRRLWVEGEGWVVRRVAICS